MANGLTNASTGKSGNAKEDLGITVKKSADISEWYTQVVLKAELADYSSGKGFIVIRPYAYEMWDMIKNCFDSEIKKTGHRNAYFPTLIPESLLKKEAEHFAGFTPEVFWVTHAGTTELSERYAVRPTSETIIHDAMSRWIRSWRDLPLLLNVWNSVLRAEIKSTKPFLRTSEFLWQEGHTAHATDEEAASEVMGILLLYKKVIEELLAISVLVGRKSEKEKFVGALYTTTLESMMPDGKALQMGTSHHLGQNFSKPFEIRFLGEGGEMRYVWQTSWGITWRLIGALVMEHGDDNGLVVPPRVAPIQIVIIPILFSGGKAAEIISRCKEIQSALEASDLRVHLDSRENYTPGWKFNQWEMKGVPLRIEVGPRDLANNVAVLVRRDTGKKETVKLGEIQNFAKETLEQVQGDLLANCRKRQEEMTSRASSFEELSDIIETKGGFVRSFWCGSQECETKVKEKTGADIRVIPFEQPKELSKCIICGKSGRSEVYFARAY
ncbi:MAG: proline--tRNA ligase [Nitrososphaerales archaeon]